MSTTYTEPRHSRIGNRRLVTIVGIAILLALGAGAAVTFWPSGGFGATTEPAGASDLTFTIGTISGASGAPVQAPIRVSGADGLGSATLKLTYDATVVKVASVAKGDLADSTLTYHHEPSTGSLAMLLTTPRASGIEGSGVYAVVTLEAVEGAMGKSAPLTLAVASAASSEASAIEATATSGSFRNGVPGDVSGNGVVDAQDYDLLSRYLVGEPVTILALNADLDGDGKVTDLDALKLHQQLSG